ncbi:hypothetical protein I6F35_06150 [Bradyrhizobium sp. BRP22]|uniref:hypothetical protein n=1 Tax=Bradyrhizobium sp. BRP22 TaxID=2793821 RepID=UPI001CD6B068|nr:hypothetical protein [Bradyrhizobium sp. BRP22]MCA1452801.1 hypothetical protein [Bradyrhizobium sp. BRP22]
MGQSDDGTALGLALKVVEDWKVANNLGYLAPRLSRDLAKRIERALLEERSEAGQP